MTLKILKKNEARALQEKQTRDQIDEGITLVRKTEELRSELQTLQKQHADFIGGMKAELAREIGPLKAEKETLAVEVEQARAELVRLRQPLDAEWSSARELMAQAVKKTADLDERERKLYADEVQLETDQEEVEKQRTDVAVAQKEADDKNADATDCLSEAEKVLTNAKTHADHVNAELDKRERGLEDWERTLDYKEVDLENREEDLNNRAKLLNERETYVNDRYATLERTLNRTKQV